MNAVEAVDRLTDIVIRQAEIIRELHHCLAQHSAVTSIETGVNKVIEDTNGLLTELSAGI